MVDRTKGIGGLADSSAISGFGRSRRTGIPNLEAALENPLIQTEHFRIIRRLDRHLPTGDNLAAK